MIYDICIVGGGVSGSMAVYEIATNHKDKKAILIEYGRPAMKRRQQIAGWLGLLPSSDGKFFLNDIKAVANLTTPKKAKTNAKQVVSLLKSFSTCKTIKDKGPSTSARNRIDRAGYKVQLNDYFQLYPKDIHALSKFMSEEIDKAGNVTCSFDNEVQSITKHKNIFTIQTELQEVRARKVILCMGHGGWREARNIFHNFDIIENNDTARFGIRMELPAGILKDFNKSTCKMTKGDVEIGPLSWFGSVVPVDASDFAMSGFRSNENRWKTDKVSFQFIGSKYFPNQGFEQTDRIGGLTFLLATDRVLKEKVSSIINKKNKIISIIEEYDWLPEAIKEFAAIVPEVLTKAYFHIPTVVPMVPEINIGNNLSTEVDGMFVAGETAGIIGLYAAAITGMISANEACKK